MQIDSRRQNQIYLIALVAVLSLGAFLRLPDYTVREPGSPLHLLAPLHPQPMFTGIGFDEALYRKYLNSVITQGLGSYPFIVDRYIEQQGGLTGSILPPVRFLFIFAGYVWHLVFRTEALLSLQNVAALFSVLTLGLATIFAWRMKGRIYALGVAALMSVAPTQVHMSQHALVDGFFTFWALLCLWLCWENLQSPRDLRLLAAYALALSLLVLTKENAFFVWIGLIAILIANRWLKFGAVNRELVLATIVGPLLGVAILVCLAGGIETLFRTYQLSVSKNFTLNFAVLTGDGPWHRYLVDLLLVSPIIVLLALGTVLRLNRAQKPEIFLIVFVAASYLIMCNLKYGMNLRYANMWDMPLRFLALTQLLAFTAWFTRYKTACVSAAIALVATYEFRQCRVLLVEYPMYQLTSANLLRAQQIIKSPAP